MLVWIYFYLKQSLIDWIEFLFFLSAAKTTTAAASAANDDDEEPFKQPSRRLKRRRQVDSDDDDEDYDKAKRDFFDMTSPSRQEDIIQIDEPISVRQQTIFHEFTMNSFLFSLLCFSGNSSKACNKTL